MKPSKKIKKSLKPKLIPKHIMKKKTEVKTLDSLLDLILKKRDGGTLHAQEIQEWIVSMTSSNPPPDYQISALLAFIYQQGMNEREIASLTDSMRYSGEQFDYKNFPKGSFFVDKHSTGGVGDKITLPLMPLVLAADDRFYYPTIAGRGLGHTGGTVDKLESIPGFRSDLSMSEFYKLLKKNRGAFLEQTKQITPADRILYALRDVTGTVESIPLITASILSKKLSESLSFLILDVKYGNGAFLSRVEQAERLAQSLLTVAQLSQLPANVFITRMDTPLGHYSGHHLEIQETLDILEGKGPASSTALTILFAERFLVSGGIPPDRARKSVEYVLQTGQAREKFEELVHAQGGSLKKWSKKMKESKVKTKILTAPRRGYLSFDVKKLGWALLELGGGRKKKDDKIDHAVGLHHPKETGDRVEEGEDILAIYYRHTDQLAKAERIISEAVKIVDESFPKNPLVRKILSS